MNLFAEWAAPSRPAKADLEQEIDPDAVTSTELATHTTLVAIGAPGCAPATRLTPADVFQLLDEDAECAEFDARREWMHDMGMV